jgi:hypothetical protein
MRPLLKYGVPAAAGLATGGYALSQGEDPGSAVLAGLAGGAGAAGGLLASRQLAGKYAPSLYKAGLSGKQAMDLDLLQKVAQMEARQKGEGMEKGLAQKGIEKLLSLSANAPIPQQEQVQRALGKTLSGGLVPASAGLAGLGGIAAGAIPGAMGIPGFNQNVITDPELIGSSNTQMARTYTPTLKYIS